MNGQNSYRIAGYELGTDGSKALTSLLLQLRPYLKRDWSVADPADADIVVAHAGNEPTQGEVKARIVRVAVKPRTYGYGTLHWPLRVSEMLALLSEFVPSGASAQVAAPTEAISPLWVVRLEAWPIDLSRYSREEYRVMAALTFSPRDVDGLAQVTGLDTEIVLPIVARLWREQLLNRTAAAHSLRPSMTTSSPLRMLAQQLGRMLGFGRHA